MKTVKVIVSGRVQGVWFRASTRSQAVKLGIKGYVRNMPDGNVEFVAEGDDAAVDRLIAWARMGPPAAKVNNLHLEVLPYRGDFRDFSMRH